MSWRYIDGKIVTDEKVKSALIAALTEGGDRE
jgi:hypothetical protein